MTPMVPHPNPRQYDDYIVHPVGLPDGRIATIAPLLFGRAILTVATAETHVWGQYDEGWEYDHHQPAIYALIVWNGKGEPFGWTRHPKSGRRRPDGDPAREYIRR